MIEENASVVSIHLAANETGDGLVSNKVTVESEIKSSCSGCKQVDNCGSGQVAKAFPQPKLSLDLYTDLPVKIGDTVVIGLSDKHLLLSAWQVYLWPLIGLVIASFLGQWFVENEIFNHELIAIAFGVFGGYLGFCLARHQQKRGKYCNLLIPRILRINPSSINIVEITD
ncbi:MAG: SoxR reducing system RseC family protein [Alteromonadaceae bacterium]|jgi:sigma-E factor negative regulatory protein RseC